MKLDSKRVKFEGFLDDYPKWMAAKGKMPQIELAWALYQEWRDGDTANSMLEWLYEHYGVDRLEFTDTLRTYWMSRENPARYSLILRRSGGGLFLGSSWTVSQRQIRESLPSYCIGHTSSEPDFNDNWAGDYG